MKYCKHAYGVAVAYVMTALLLFVMAFLLYKLQLPFKNVNIGIVLIYVLANMAGGYTAGKIGKKRKYLWGLLNGACYFTVLIILTVLYRKGLAGNQLLTSFVLCCGSGMLGGMVS